MGDEGVDWISGGDGYDHLAGNDQGDFLYGDGNNDYLDGASGNDLLDGGTGADYLWGGDGSDTLRGGDHNDVIGGELGLEAEITGGAGSDTFVCREDGQEYRYRDSSRESSQYTADCHDTVARNGVELASSIDVFDWWAPRVDAWITRHGNYRPVWEDDVTPGLVYTTTFYTTSSVHTMLLDARAPGGSLLMRSGGDLPVAGYFCREPRTTEVDCATISNDSIGVYRSTTGEWLFDVDLDGVAETSLTVDFGDPLTRPNDRPFAGDFDEDGLADLGLLDSANRYIRIDYGADGMNVYEYYVNWLSPGDLPVAGDFYGVGFDSIAVFRPFDDVWYFIRDIRSSTSPSHSLTGFDFGGAGAVPIAGNFDDNPSGIDGIGLNVPWGVTWYFDLDPIDECTYDFGLDWAMTDWERFPYGGFPLAGNFDGDGDEADLVVIDPAPGPRTQFPLVMDADPGWAFLYDPAAGASACDGLPSPLAQYNYRDATVEESFFDGGEPVRAAAIQYDTSCGPTSLAMVFDFFGMTDFGYGEGWAYSADLADDTPDNFAIDPGVNSWALLSEQAMQPNPNPGYVDIGYWLSAEHIILEGLREDWPDIEGDEAMLLYQDPVTGLPTSFLNTSESGVRCSGYDIDYIIGYCNSGIDDVPPVSGDNLQSWLAEGGEFGLGFHGNTNHALALVANQHPRQIEFPNVSPHCDARSVDLQYGIGRMFQSLAHVQDVFRAFIDHGIPFVISTNHGSHMNTVIGYLEDSDGVFYVLTGEPNDGIRKWWGAYARRAMRWQRIPVTQYTIYSGLIGAMLLYGYSVYGCEQDDWALALDDEYGVSGDESLCGHAGAEDEEYCDCTDYCCYLCGPDDEGEPYCDCGGP